MRLLLWTFLLVLLPFTVTIKAQQIPDTLWYNIEVDSFYQYRFGLAPDFELDTELIVFTKASFVTKREIIEDWMQWYVDSSDQFLIRTEYDTFLVKIYWHEKLNYYLRTR